MRAKELTVTLIYLAIAWMLGVIATDALTPPLFPLQLAAGAAGLVVFVARRAPPVRLAALLLCCAALGGWRYQAVQPPIVPGDVRLLVDQGDVTLYGWVSADPKRDEEGQQVVLSVEAADAGHGPRVASGLVLLKLPPYPQRRYGERLTATGELVAPRAAKRPGTFDYRAYLARKRIFALLYEPNVRQREGIAGSAVLRALLAFRDRCQAVLLRELPEPQASIAIGVLLGLQASIPDSVYATFSVTGTSHILVVSGWNFTIVASMLAGLATRARLGRGATLAVSLAVLWCYALFVGASGTVLRAAVMASLMVLARATTRQSEPWTLLFAACCGLSVYDPNVLWDLGFQLSALATASLFAFGRPVEQMLARVPLLNQPWLGWANEALTATLAAQILALPPILYHFGNLSLIAPLANVLLVPVVPYVMLLSSVALVAGLIALPLGQWAALPCWLALAWLTEGARLLAQTPWAAVQVPPFPLWALLTYYAVVVGAWLRYVMSRNGIIIDSKAE
jgi:competence protein ComEC